MSLTYPKISCSSRLTYLCKIIICISLFSENYQNEVEGAPSIGSHFFPSHFNWKHADMEFLTGAPPQNDLSKKDFHIAKIKIPSSNLQSSSSYMIHVSRTEGLFHPEAFGLNHNETEHLECIYSGTIHEVTTSSDSGHQSTQSGLVSFSSCHHRTGFEGLIMLPDAQYYIKPHPSSRLLIKRSLKDSHTVPHQVHTIDPVKDAHKIDGVAHPSPEQVRRALKNQDNSRLDLLDDENPYLEEDDIPSQYQYHLNSISPQHVSRHVKNHGKILNGRRGSSGTRTTKASSSSSSSSRVVELAIFTDEAMYIHWKSTFPQNTYKAVQQYVLMHVNQMNMLYQHPSLTEKVTLRLVFVDIYKTNPRGLEVTTKANKYLQNICDYSSERNEYGALWDHTMMLSGEDLINENTGGSDINGLAYLGAMCVRELACSLVEGNYFGAPFVGAHELAHNLGADHDGSGRNSDCDENSYLMSPSSGPNKFSWSECTNSNMKEFMEKGMNFIKAPKCLRKKSSKGGINFSGNKLPGQLFDAEAQCSSAYPGYLPHLADEPPFQNICEALYCKPPGDPPTFNALSKHAALEGTSCASGKICRQGRCQ